MVVTRLVETPVVALFLFLHVVATRFCIYKIIAKTIRKLLKICKFLKKRKKFKILCYISHESRNGECWVVQILPEQFSNLSNCKKCLENFLMHCCIYFIHLMKVSVNQAFCKVFISLFYQSTWLWLSHTNLHISITLKPKNHQSTLQGHCSS